MKINLHDNNNKNNKNNSCIELEIRALEKKIL